MGKKTATKGKNTAVKAAKKAKAVEKVEKKEKKKSGKGREEDDDEDLEGILDRVSCTACFDGKICEDPS
jgi:hypothetical protein